MLAASTWVNHGAELKGFLLTGVGFLQTQTTTIDLTQVFLAGRVSNATGKVATIQVRLYSKGGTEKEPEPIRRSAAANKAQLSAVIEEMKLIHSIQYV